MMPPIQRGVERKRLVILYVNCLTPPDLSPAAKIWSRDGTEIVTGQNWVGLGGNKERQGLNLLDSTVVAKYPSQACLSYLLQLVGSEGSWEAFKIVEISVTFLQTCKLVSCK